MKNNKTILQIVPALNTGGVERGVIEISKYISEKNFRSIVISSGGKFEHQVTKFGGIHYKLDVHSKNFLKWSSIRKKLTKIIISENVNLIHVCSRVPAWLALPIARKLKIPLITSVHGRFRKQNILKNYYNSVLLKGDHIIAISKHIENSIVSMHPQAKSNIRVIYRGVDQSLFDKNNIPVSRIINQMKLMDVNDENPIIIMASRPKFWKGQASLIRALSKLKKDFQCVLIGTGDGEPGFQKKIVDLIEKLNLGGKVKLTPSTNDIQAAFMLGDVIVMPSVNPEPFGRIIIEGQSLEKIVVGYDHGGISETIIDGETGFLAKPTSEDSLAEKIDIALSLNDSQRKKIGKLAKKSVERNFSHVKMCEDTFALYKQCLNEYRIKFELNSS